MSWGEDGRYGAQVVFERVGHVFSQRDRAIEVHRDLSFEIAPGETLAIVGPSGSGKTTLLNLIMGRLRPTHGQVEVTAPPGRTLRRAVVFQRPTLLPWLTAFDNVRLPLELEANVAGADADERVREALARVGLSDFSMLKPQRLSGGMQSRVSLARGLVTNPNLMVMDEPLNDLDEATSEDLMIDMAQLIEQSRATAALVTHSLKLAAYLADRVIVLRPRAMGVAATYKIAGGRPRTRAHLDDPQFHHVVRTLRDTLKEAIGASRA